MHNLEEKQVLFEALDAIDSDVPSEDETTLEAELPFGQSTSSFPSIYPSHFARPITPPRTNTSSSPLADQNSSPASGKTVDNEDREQTPPASDQNDLVPCTFLKPPSPADQIVGDLPKPLTAAARKKRNHIVPKPKELQVFRGLVFYFFPNSDTGAARNFRITKAIQFGAKWTREWNPLTTHIIVDRGLSKSDIDKFVGLKNISPSTAIVDETFPADCIEHNRLLDPSNYLFLVAGFGKPQKRSHRLEPSDSSEQTLDITHPLKRPKGEPRNLLTSSQRRALAARSPNPENTADLQMTSQRQSQSTCESNDELNAIIAAAKSTEHLPLDSVFDSQEEWSDSSLSSARDIRRHKEDSSTASRLQGKTPSSDIPKWQHSFTCMSSSKKVTDLGTAPNGHIIALLQEMAEYYASINDEWRPRAYRIAISALKKHPTEITSAAEARKIRGIGPRLADKIEEIHWTSRLRRLDNAKGDESDAALRLFSGIYGVGPRLASRWVQEGHRTLADLAHARVALTPNQRLGLAHYDDFAQRIPRAEVAQHAAVVAGALHALDEAFGVVVGGSFRRGAPTCGDIDLVVSHPARPLAHTRAVVLDTLVPRLTAAGFLTAALAASGRADGTKWHGACQLPAAEAAGAARPWRRIDLLLVPADELGAALLYFTGNDVFNRSMRLLARKKGMRLNQRGLYRDVLRGPGALKMCEGTKIAGQDERQIFDILGVPWRECAERDA